MCKTSEIVIRGGKLDQHVVEDLNLASIMPPKKRNKKDGAPQLDDEAEYEFKINLIELVQMYPEIYDIQSPGHKKNYIRNAA